MLKFKGLSAIRLSAYSHKEPTAIFDFDNEWHCALMLKRGMSKSTVADKLESLAYVVREQARKENETATK